MDRISPVPSQKHKNNMEILFSLGQHTYYVKANAVEVIHCVLKGEISSRYVIIILQSMIQGIYPYSFFFSLPKPDLCIMSMARNLETSRGLCMR